MKLRACLYLTLASLVIFLLTGWAYDDIAWGVAIAYAHWA
jgi:hypothetical protein